MTPEITNLAQFGVAGLAVYFMYKISSNHLSHLTQAIEKLVVAVDELKEWLHTNKKYTANPATPNCAKFVISGIIL